MKNLRIAATIVGLLTALPASALAQCSAGRLPPKSVPAARSSRDVAPQASSAKVTVHATKGVVKFVDADKLVIRRTPRDGREMTFVLIPSTERSGDIEAGSSVDVRYRSDADQQIATAVTVVQAKQP